MLPQETTLIKFHGDIQGCLSAEGRQKAVRRYLQDKLLDHFRRQRFNVYFVGNIFICHDGRRVGVDQNHMDAFFL